jgi:hypothetical protein
MELTVTVGVTDSSKFRQWVVAVLDDLPHSKNHGTLHRK